MATIVRMPKLGSTMETGTVVTWFKREGDGVTQGEPLFEVMTEKITNVIEAPASGVLVRIVAPEGSEHPVRSPLAVIAAPGEDFSSAMAEAGLDFQSPAQVGPSEPSGLAAQPAAESAARNELKEAVIASPIAKRIAKDHGIDLSELTGTGPDGRITREDVERYIADRTGNAPDEGMPCVAPARQAPAQEGRTLPGDPDSNLLALSPMRKLIAERMTASSQTTPHVTLMTEVDMTDAVRLCEELNAEAADVKITLTDFVVKAVAKALRRFPRVNSSFSDQGLRLFSEVNVGVAVALEDGLVVPKVRNADSKDLLSISGEIKGLAAKARANALSERDVSDGTFTVSNLGMYGVDFFTPIINPPESAILGVGRAADKPVVRNGEISVRKMMGLSFSFDHRAIDGAQAADFLREVVRSLERPFSLVLL
ncbi:MAG: 2-oxo acid dehydrogenase subunit E2 [Firmicutes bacterium]|jgi:pyruvate dehydrogenase E2 component (dihydrolipoamide acetyltransferase)|nr:2-oxo acid dehydrogenase subunit E2 [Bacillota bacterium]MDH7495708.1 dihydrolipoamide acetyltransferase family protein [Bacillota bacterium]